MAQANNLLMEKKNQTLTTHFVKTSDFRTHYITGIFGGVTSSNQISMSFFIERNVIPKDITYDVSDEGVPTEIGRETKLGIVRETPAGVLLDLNTAKSIVGWLTERISQVESNIKPQ